MQRAPRLDRILNLAAVLLIHLAVGLSSAQENSDKIFRSAFPLDSLKNVARSDAQVSANILIKRVIEAQGYQYATSTPENHSEFIPRMLAGEFDMFLMFAYEYIRQRDNYGITPQVVGSMESEDPRHRLLLLTNTEKPLESISGGTLIIQVGTGELSRIWLEEELAKQGKSVDDVFTNIETGSNVGKAALPVFFKKADACIVTEESFDIVKELNPQVGTRLKTAAVSEPLLSTIICLRSDYQEIRKGQVKDVAVNLHKTPDGSQLLTMMGVKKLVPFEPHLIEGVEKLLRTREARISDPVMPEVLSENETEPNEDSPSEDSNIVASQLNEDLENE